LPRAGAERRPAGTLQFPRRVGLRRPFPERAARRLRRPRRPCHQAMSVLRSGALVLFGATGDLAAKMLYPALQSLSQRGELEMPVIGIARSEWDDARLRDYARRSLEQHGGFDAKAFE